MKVLAYLISLGVLTAGLTYSFIDLGIGLLVVLVSGTAAVFFAEEIKKDWNNRE